MALYGQSWHQFISSWIKRLAFDVGAYLSKDIAKHVFLKLGRKTASTDSTISHRIDSGVSLDPQNGTSSEITSSDGGSFGTPGTIVTDPTPSRRLSSSTSAGVSCSDRGFLCQTCPTEI